MAKVTYVDILPELEKAFFACVRPGDRFVFSRLARKITLFSRKKKKGLTLRSLLPQISEVWETFSAEEKKAWSSAGAKSALNGWRLFVQDQSARIKNEMPGSAVPSLLHQSWVGNLKIELPASEIKIVQLHPRFYWISKKVKGTKSQYEPVLITEDFRFPLKISLNYSSNLVETAEGSFAKFYARVWHSFQGQNLYTDLEIPLDYVSGWKNAEATLTILAGYVVRYDLYFHLKNLTGDLYIDNVKAEHSAQNWVRDTFCKDVNQGFTRAFYQIPKHWAAVILPVGAWYDSIYKDFITLMSRARAYPSISNQSIPDQTWTKVVLDTEDFDVGDEFDPVTNYRFTASEAGYYVVVGLVSYISCVADKRIEVSIYKNGADSSKARQHTSSTAPLNVFITNLLYLNAGDYVELWTWHDFGVAKNLYTGNNLVFMGVFKLTD